MSTLVVDITVYSSVYQKMLNTDVLGIDRDNVGELEDLIRTWCILNELSYVYAYKKKGETYESLVDFINLKKWKEITPLQLIKYLHAIRYNINDREMEKTSHQADSIIELDRVISTLEYSYIANMDKYQPLKWSE